MAQLWMRELVGEYAMNKPEGEIWPETTITARKLMRTWIDCENGYIKVSVNNEGEETEFSNDNIRNEYIERHRTHCPDCWKKYETWSHLNSEMAGHEAFHCRADDDLYPQFPRKG